MNDSLNWQKLPKVINSVLNSLTEGILILDINLTVLFCNRASTTFFENNIIDESFSKFIYKQSVLDSIKSQVIQNPQNINWLDNIELITKTNKKIWVSFSIQSIQQDTLDCFIVRFQNNTNQDERQKNHDIELINQKLRDSELKYKNIIENASDVIYSADHKGYFTYANTTACNIVGITEEELKKVNFIELIHPDYKVSAAEFYQKQFTETILNTYYEFPIINKNNQTIWLGQSVQMEITNNWITGFHAVARDITDRKNAEIENIKILQELSERESRFNAIIENSSNNIWALDAQGNFIAFNKSFNRSWKNYTKNDIILGYNWLEYLKEKSDDIPEFKTWLNHLQKALKGEKFSFEDKRKQDGNIVYYEVQVNPIISNNEKITGTIFMSHDITSRKLEEQELIKAKTAAEDLVIAKEQFLSVMSHEIRTPMNGILGMSHLLELEDLTPTQKEFIKSIRFSADNLLVIINDILDYSKIQAGKMQFESIDFNIEEIVKNNIFSFEFAAKEKLTHLSYEIEAEIPRYLTGDPTRLNQILTNLIGNAVKFTTNGKVNISVKLVKTDGNINTIKFEIADTGIGIESEKINSIFDIFTQADTATTRKFGGTGLGLSITKNLVELQKGQISVKSQPNIGSTFSFIIDFKTGKSTTHMSHSNNENSLTIFDNLQVLIAEDNKMNQLVVSKLMSKWGVQIDIAEDGQEAIEKSKEKAYDIILMDLQMPNIDGYDATISIRNDKQNLCQNTPIIALTASVTGDVKDKCLEVGMNDYVSKPIEALLLNQKIASYHPNKKLNTDTSQVSKNYTNLKYLLENADGDMAFVSQMINIFNKQVPEALKDLYREESNKDLTALKAVSHKMRPSFSAFGIDDGKNILEEIESICAKKEKIDTLVSLIKKLENICDIASIELTKKLTEIEKL